MEEKQLKLDRYFDEQIALCGQRNKELLADERTDEATFEKIKANIYDIFRTVLSVAVTTCKDGPDEVRNFFVKRIEQIPSNWADAYEKAKEHDHTINMQIEKVKLDTVDEIKKIFEAIWEGAQ